jgi:hypothetical protein
VAGAAGRVAERTSEERLPYTDRTEEDHVLASLDKAEAEELLDAVPVEGHGSIPVEAFEGLVLLEAGSGEANLEVLLIPAVDLVLEDELEEVELRELRFLRVGQTVREGREQSRELQAFEDGLQGRADLHGRVPFVRG